MDDGYVQRFGHQVGAVTAGTTLMTLGGEANLLHKGGERGNGQWSYDDDDDGASGRRRSK